MLSAYNNMAEWLGLVSSEPVSMVLGSARLWSSYFWRKRTKKMGFLPPEGLYYEERLRDSWPSTQSRLHKL